MASIYKTESGKYRASVVAADGRRITKTYESRTRAELWAAEAEHATADRVAVQARILTVGEVAMQYADEVLPVVLAKRSIQTRRNAQLRMGQFARSSLGPVVLGKLNASHIMQYRDERLRVVQGASVRRELAALSGLLNYVIREWRYLNANPMRDITRPADNAPRKVIPTADQVAAVVARLGFVDGVEPRTSSEWFGLFLALSYELGTRAHELMQLPQDQPRVAVGVLRIAENTKTGGRDVPMTKRAAELWPQLVAASRKQAPAGQWWPHTYHFMCRQYRRVRDSAGLAGVHVHDFRAGAATRFAANPKVTPQILCKIMGHTNIATTMRYYRPDAADFVSLIND
ncbi:MAG: tyrosine-type recombinase/integrase [Fluviibacter sp.]